MMQLQTSSLVAQTAAFFNAAGRSNSIAANGHLPLFSAATFMGLPFNKFLCRRFRRLSQTHQTRAEINTGPLAPKRSEYGEGVLFLFTDWQHKFFFFFLRFRCLKFFTPAMLTRRPHSLRSGHALAAKHLCASKT